MTLKSKIKTFNLVRKHSSNSSLEIIQSYFNKNKKLKLYFFKEHLSWNDAKALSYGYHFGWIPKKEKNKFYFENKKNKRKFFIPFSKNGVFTEDYKDFYGMFNYKDKRVLDIGAYIGDTLLFFLKNNAKKISCYEPIKENLDILTKNFKEEIKLKKMKIYPFAVCNKNGKMILSVNPNSIGKRDFGNGKTKGKTKIELNCVSWKNVLSSDKFDIAKVDCEGGEFYLKNCSNEEIRRISCWVIEAHTRKIEKILLKKFKSSGFSLIKKERINSQTSILSFKLKKKITKE